MSDTSPAENPTGMARKISFFAALALVVLLSIASCTFILLIPTSSLNVDIVYEGF